MGNNSKQQDGRILIVDDEASLRKVLKATLQREGYSIETAKNGAEALGKLETAQAKGQGEFDVLICDVHAKMNGMTLLDGR